MSQTIIKRYKGYFDGYKLSHKVIKKLSVLRIHNHLKEIKNIYISYFCSCCGELSFNMNNDGKEAFDFYRLSRYKNFLIKEMKNKKCFQEIIDEKAALNYAKHINRRNKGCQKLSKTKKKLLLKSM